MSGDSHLCRYVGPDKADLLAAVKQVIELWQQEKENFRFPIEGEWNDGYRMFEKDGTDPSTVAALAAVRLTGWFASSPDEDAKSFAAKARSGAVPTTDDEHGNAWHYCSSFIAATWQSALGLLGKNTEDDETNLSRMPMHAMGSSPTDWSVLPQRSPYWEIVGIVSDFSNKRQFGDWYDE